MDKLELDQIFSLAISREIEAYEFYGKVSASVDNIEVKKVFDQLAKEEMEHQTILEKLKADPQSSMNLNTHLQDYKVAEATELPRLSTDMKPVEAIKLAMKKEQISVEFYLSLWEKATDPEIKKIFSRLRDMEMAHKQQLENIFVEIGYPEVF
ncbi:MAG: ferritin family protein [Candidatus Omnitrophota bacterium]|nr:ferritin family protein [Candidatus Omnitrophota bacterium]